MTARILDGRRASEEIRREVAAGVEALRRERGIAPNLAIVLVGDNAASRVYTRSKSRASREVGMEGDLIQMPEQTRQEELLGLVQRLNRDARVHGILVQLPLPPHIETGVILEAVDPAKDVDGFHPVNAGRLLSGLDSLLPCTPAGIVELLRRHEIPLTGREAVVLGRSNIVGKPVAVLLLRENATVTICHSRTKDIASVTSRADLLICAIGRKAFVRTEHIRPGAVVVDVGINRCESVEEARELFGENGARVQEVREKGHTLVGDVHPAEAMAVASWFSPVPGGVGPMTIAMLLRNTLLAATRQGAATA
jgi:methylenetetrahydrofolate dehydrogenase (NADP+)/methenyltetrahydrofolate cyclohydrolase